MHASQYLAYDSGGHAPAAISSYSRRINRVPNLDRLATEGARLDNTADPGFFLGEHGWYDRRFMHEPSIHIPFLRRYPRAVKADTVIDKVVINTDFAPTLLDYAGQAVPEEMQGRSLRPRLSR